MSEDKLPQRIVIIGGVAGGASAAARARRCSVDAEITVLEKGQYVSFANCGLPYHLGGEIAERSKLLVATPELFWDRFRIRIRTGHNVQSIDRKAKTVTGLLSTGEEFKVPYDRLILATGSQPITPGFLKEPVEGAFHLWTMDDMDRVVEYMKNRSCKSVTVVGAGLIGLEVAEQLAHRDISVTVVQKSGQVLNMLDTEIAKLVERELERSGVKLAVNSEVTSLLASNKRVSAVKIGNDRSFAADLVIVAAGVRPRVHLAEQCGLEIGAAGGVVIDEYCRTSDHDVYAVGDMVEYHHRLLGRPTLMPLAGPANRAGRLAGAHAVGAKAGPLGQVLGTTIVRVFGLSIGCTGLSEARCVSEGIPHRVAIVQAAHHASYFPGAKNLTLKIVYSPEGKLLGGQAIGAEGVDKRIDILASLLQLEGTIEDMANLDLAYAPPFGSAKDPLHMAAFVAQNDLDSAPRLAAFDADLAGLQVVDVRESKELEKLPLPNAIHIPINTLSDRWHELDPNRRTVTVCHSGKRAHVAACFLQGKGFDVANLSGGMSIRQLTASQ